MNLFVTLTDAAQPFLLKEVITYIGSEKGNTKGQGRALGFAFLMIANIFFSRIFRENLGFYQLKVGVQTKQAISAIIY